METRTIEIDDLVIARIKKALENSIGEYAKGREKDIARGAESEELAGLIIEKYGYGVNEAARILFEIMDLPRIDLVQVVDKTQELLDPNAKANRKLRWDARPATITLVNTT